jgi:Na+/H+ antiporter NhaD/arsenite permease-like protein
VNLTTNWVGLVSLAIFLLAYALVIAEEALHLRKSTPVIVASGVLWILLAFAYGQLGQPAQVDAALREVLGDFVNLLLFLIAAMTYVNALDDRRIFDALRSWLVRSGFSYRTLFWLTGTLAFFISPFADNLTTALVMCAVAVSVGRAAPRFVVLSSIGIVVAANAGGAFSPFGDITTLMVWQKGLVSFFEFFALFVPSVVNYLAPAVLMHAAVPRGAPSSSGEPVSMKPGAVWVILLFLVTIAMAVGVHTFLHLPAALGMMTGLGFLMLYDYHLEWRDRRAPGEFAFHVFHRMANVEWDTLLFF